MAIGLTAPDLTNFGSRLGAAIDPSQTASSGQGGIGGLLMQLQQNPAAIQALLNTSANLLNPQTFGSPAGRIMSAVAGGVEDYSGRKTAAEDKARERKIEDKKLGLQERQVGQGDRQLDIKEEQLGIEEQKFQQRFSLDQDQLEAQKKLWAAQAERWAAEADRLRSKGTDSDKLTGPERIINNLAQVFVGKDVPPDKAYVMAFDIYNKSGTDKAKAISGAVESIGILATDPEGKALLEDMIRIIDENFTTGTSQLEGLGQPGQAPPQQQEIEVVPGVTQVDIDAAMAELSQSEGRPITAGDLNEAQLERLYDVIRQRKQGVQ